MTISDLPARARICESPFGNPVATTQNANRTAIVDKKILIAHLGWLANAWRSIQTVSIFLLAPADPPSAPSTIPPHVD